MTFENPIKVTARDIGFRWFLSSGITPKQYWTLCNFQSESPDAEISQALALGVVPDASQFNGVDVNEKAIEHNRKLHPQASWWNGEWTGVLLNAKARGAFSPSLVYLDTFMHVDFDAPHLVAWTMRLCPPDTHLIANVMLTTSRSNKRLDNSRFLERVAAEAGAEASAWEKNVERFDYRASRTLMGSYCFRKRTA